MDVGRVNLEQVGGVSDQKLVMVSLGLYFCSLEEILELGAA